MSSRKYVTCDLGVMDGSTVAFFARELPQVLAATGKYPGGVEFEIGEKRVDGKSYMSLLNAAVELSRGEEECETPARVRFEELDGVDHTPVYNELAMLAEKARLPPTPEEERAQREINRMRAKGLI